MGVMPLPKTSSLFLGGRFDNLDKDFDRQLGRMYNSKKDEKEKKKMAINFVKGSALPVAVRGKVATEPMAAISEMGRIVFNKLATDWLKGQEATRVLIGYDGEKGKMYCWPIKAGEAMPFKQDDSDAMALGYGTDKATKKQLGPKDEKAGATGTGVQNSAPMLRGIDYRYKTAGQQTFKIEFKEVQKRQTMVFDLPVGDKTPAAKAKAPRKAKVAKVGAVATPATPNVAAGAEDELIME